MFHHVQKKGPGGLFEDAQPRSRATLVKETSCSLHSATTRGRRRTHYVVDFDDVVLGETPRQIETQIIFADQIPNDEKVLEVVSYGEAILNTLLVTMSLNSTSTWASSPILAARCASASVSSSGFKKEVNCA